MAKSELFEEHGRWFRILLKTCGVFPVKRSSADRKSVNRASTLLQQGKVVGIFPQGRIVRGHQPFELKSGAALLAARTGMPLLPAVIVMKNRPKLFSRISVRILPPLFPEDGSLKGARKLTVRLQEVMTREREQTE